MGFASSQRYCTASGSGRQPNFAALNRGRHLCLAGRPSGWALAHILVIWVLLLLLRGERRVWVYTTTITTTTLLEEKVPLGTNRGAKLLSAKRHPQWCHLAPQSEGTVMAPSGWGAKWHHLASFKGLNYGTPWHPWVPFWHPKTGCQEAPFKGLNYGTF